ncbi:MAG: hypothetical protein AABX65_02405 [Nanoarchaeota archaeon]
MKTGLMKNWEKIVRNLKAGPDFAIHGTRYQNLEGMLEQNRRGLVVYGHNFSVGKKEKRLPDNGFYNRLVASTGIAIGHSTFSKGGMKTYNFDDTLGRYVFEEPIALIIGVADEKYKEFNVPEDKSIEGYVPWLDIVPDTFPIGHDFVNCNLTSCELYLDELDAISEKVNRDLIKIEKDKIIMGMSIVRAIICYRYITESMIR